MIDCEKDDVCHFLTYRTLPIFVLIFRCRGVLLLSGTPMKNGRPSNLFPLLRAVRHPFGENQKRYEFYFCNGQQRNFGTRTTWDVGSLVFQKKSLPASLVCCYD